MRRDSRVMVAARVSSLALLLAGVVGFGTAAVAASQASATITLSTSTAPNGAVVTATLTVSCSVTGGCQGTTLTLPTNTVTGDGSTTDFGGWVSNTNCPALSVAAGAVKFAFGNIPTGSQLCTFTIKPPHFLTLNGTQISVTPTVSGTNFASSPGPTVTLTVTAGD